MSTRTREKNQSLRVDGGWRPGEREEDLGMCESLQDLHEGAAGLESLSLSDWNCMLAGTSRGAQE
jgi:hypothetical protein